MKKHTSKLNIKDFFVKQESGGVLIMIGLAFTILVLSAGFAIDYSRAQIVQSRMQWALDAAAFAGAKASSDGNAQMRAKAQAFFNANFPENYMGLSTGGRPTVNLAAGAQHFGSTSQGFRFTVTGVRVKNIFVSMFGVPDIAVAAAAEVNTLPISRMDLAISVDVSGSMLGNDASGSSRIANARNGVQTLVNLLHLDGENGTRYALNAWATELRRDHGWTNTRSTILSQAGGLVAINGDCTAGYKGMSRAIDRIAESTRGNSMKAIIFMTDGYNNVVGASCQDGNATIRQQSNDLLSAQCTRAKNAGIQVFTIGYALPASQAAGVRQLLAGCATETQTPFFINANNAGELADAFRSIAARLTTMRLTR